MENVNFHIPVDLMFGCGQLNNLHTKNIPGKKALVVISRGKSTRANGYLARTEEQLHLAGLETAVFDGISANPLREEVMAGSAVARKENCDIIVALGGGSVMDSGKLIAIMATNPGDLWDYYCGGTGGNKEVENKPLPVICITTTAGTGSEMDNCGIVTNTETLEKIGIGNTDDNFPIISIVDPELMTSVPPAFTAFQGLDALFHATECYISTHANPMSEMFALTAIENIGKYLAKAVKDGNDIEAREHVSFASNLSGFVMVMGGPCIGKHALECAMSAYHPQLSHGAGLVLIAEEYYKFYIEKHVCDDRFIKMAKALGKQDSTNPYDFIDMLLDLEEKCGVAGIKMSDYGFNPEEFLPMTRNAKETMAGLFMGDRYQLSDDDCVEIFKRSFR